MVYVLSVLCITLHVPAQYVCILEHKVCLPSMRDYLVCIYILSILFTYVFFACLGTFIECFRTLVHEVLHELRTVFSMLFEYSVYVGIYACICGHIF